MKYKTSPFIVTVIALVSSLTWKAVATTLTWDSDTGPSGAQDGAGTWSAGGNGFWNGTSDVATTNDLITDIAQFGNGGTLASPATVNVASQSIKGLIFGATITSGYTLTSGSASVLTLGGGGVVLNSGAQATSLGSANLSLALGAAQSWTNNSASLFTVSGNIDNGSNLLTVGGTGGTSISGIIGSGATKTGGLTKSGSGTLTLSGANAYTGTTTLGGGTLQIGNGTSGSLNGTTGTALTFNGGGIANFNEATGSAQGMSTLTFSAGEGSVQSTYGGSGNTSLTFSNVATRTAGASGNFVITNGANGTTNKIALTQFGGVTTATKTLLDRGLFFGGSSYATYDTGGFLRAYTTGDSNFVSVATAGTMGTRATTDNVLITGNITAQTTTNGTVNTINMGANNITLSTTAQILSTNGLLSSGGSNALISTVGKLQATAAGNELVIRINGSSDKLTVAPVIQNNAGGGTSSALTKAGAGTLVLSAANTYTGLTNINSGTVKIGTATSLGAQTGTTDGTIISPGASLDLAGIALGVSAERITASGSGVAGAGAIFSSGAIASPFVGVRFLTLAGDATLGFTNRWDIGSTSLASALVGNGYTLNLIGSAAGSASLNGLGDTDLGDININMGNSSVPVVYLQGSTTLGRAANTVSIASGTTLEIFTNSTVTSFDKKFALNGANITVDKTGSVSLLGTMSLTNTNTISATGATVALTASNAISGTGSLIKAGVGSLTLSGTNNYTGTTSVSSGALQFAKTASLYNGNPSDWTAAKLSVASGAVVAFNVGGTGEFSTSDVTTLLTNLGGLGGAVSNNGLQGGSAIVFDTTNASGGTFTVADNITDSTGAGGGSIILGKSGTGILVLSGNNSFTGAVNVNAGTVNVQSSTAFGTSAGGVTVANGAALSFSGGVNVLNEALSARGAGPDGVSGAILNAGNNSWTGLISLSNSLRLKSYSGTLTLGSAALSTRAWIMTGPGNITVNGDLTGTTGSVLVDNLGNEGTSGGTMELKGANTYTGATTVTNGKLILSGNRTAAATGGITVGNGASQTGTLEISNGSFDIGTSFIVGTGDNTVSGIVNQTGGNLNVTGVLQLLVGGGGSGTTTGTASYGTYNLSGGTLSATAVANRGIILGVNAGATGTFNLSDSGNLSMGSAYLQIGRSDTAATGTTGVFKQTGGTASIGFMTIGGGSGAGFAGTTGILELTGGTFTAGVFTSLSAGDSSTSLIKIGGNADVTLPAFPTARGSGSTASITFDGGTLHPSAASTDYLGAGATPATPATNVIIKSGGAKFDVANARNITINQGLLTDTISTGGGLTKAGVGKLTLSGVSTYTGKTTISGGTLALSSTGTINNTSEVSLGTSGTFDVSAKSGYSVTKLSGSGNVIGALTVTTELAIGNSPGTASFSSDFTMGNGSSYSYELVGGTTGSNSADLGNVNGLLTIGTGVILDLAQYGAGVYTLNDKFTLFSYDTLSGTFDGLADGAVFTDAGGLWKINYDDSLGAGTNGGTESKFITVTAVPEPNAAVLIGSFGMLALIRRRKN